MHQFLIPALLLALLFAFCPAVSAQATVSITVDTSKVAANVPVSTTFKDANGAWWTCTGILTLKPTAPPVTTSQFPRIQGFYGADGAEKRAFAPGEAITVRGERFGETPGEVRLWQWSSPVLTWSDTEITAEGYKPEWLGNPPRPELIFFVVRSDGWWSNTFEQPYNPKITELPKVPPG